MASWARSAAGGADHGRPVMLTRLLALVATLTLALAGAAPAMAQGGPIKIGLLTPLTGAASALGKDMLGGTELYLDEIGRQVAEEDRAHRGGHRGCDRDGADQGAQAGGPGPRPHPHGRAPRLHGLCHPSLRGRREDPHHVPGHVLR